MRNNNLVICPKCGYSFQVSANKMEREKLKCPMCGHEFGRPPLKPGKPDDLPKERY
jgi:rubrerythrin